MLTDSRELRKRFPRIVYAMLLIDNNKSSILRGDEKLSPRRHILVSAEKLATE